MIKRAEEVIGGLLANAAEYEGHTINVVSLDEEGSRVNSEQAFAEAMADEEPSDETRDERRFDPGGFAFSAPFSAKAVKGKLDTTILNVKKANDHRTQDDLIAELVAANRALFESKISLTKDFKVIAPSHGW